MRKMGESKNSLKLSTLKSQKNWYRRSNANNCPAATMAGYRDLSNFERGIIVGAREMGHSISEVAKKFGYSHTTISQAYHEYRVSVKTSNLRHRRDQKKTLKEPDRR
ncbi:hypothetical protein AVEN_123755-1 [Araneus ventricosus]|uniref:Tc3 transposase DNA binding domain-containing protein n=1 Tax=Araneus ventricosus TaxID=182803 RepID=A0A4Y2BLR8_ARAVE|nr:hypothetical protein AVEN_123755-1 [Araneus ventricosus]